MTKKFDQLMEDKQDNRKTRQALIDYANTSSKRNNHLSMSMSKASKMLNSIASLHSIASMASIGSIQSEKTNNSGGNSALKSKAKLSFKHKYFDPNSHNLQAASFQVQPKRKVHFATNKETTN